jgi:hypothetical protein
MNMDYIILAVAVVIGIGGGLYLLAQAKRLREKRKQH